MKHELMSLPFSSDALSPAISPETLQFHHGKHHKAYVDKLNSLIPGTEFENLALEQIIRSAKGPVFNNAAQVWNHNFLWQSLAPKSREPDGELRKLLERDFGSLQSFREKFEAAGIGQFGSGWAWLVLDPKDGKVKIETTPNAENPLLTSKRPLLTADVWEHAYYIDYRNDRAGYLKTLWKLTNWEFAERNLAKAG
jgi:superoxide dismutase, Fe-Mn family